MLIYILGRPNLKKQPFWSWTNHQYTEVQRISAVLQIQWFYQHFISKYFLKHQRIFLSIRTLNAASLGWFLLQVCPKDLYQVLKIIVNLSLRLVYLELCLGMIKGKAAVFFNQSWLILSTYMGRPVFISTVKLWSVRKKKKRILIFIELLIHFFLITHSTLNTWQEIYKESFFFSLSSYFNVYFSLLKKKEKNLIIFLNV